MAGLMPRLGERASRGWLIAAVVVGVAGTAVAVLRRDYVFAVLILIAAGVIVGTRVWSGRGRGE